MSYAKNTLVTIEETIVEVRKVVVRYGGEQFMFGVDEAQIAIGFSKEGRMVRVSVPQEAGKDQRNKALARSLLLIIKAKLETIASGASLFENEFLANIVLPDGKLVGQQVRPSIAAAYEGRDMPHMLPDYSK